MKWVVAAHVFLTAACGEPAAGASATVARVIDGDTIVLQDGTHVRYLLVDTPETHHGASGGSLHAGEGAQCFGPEAAQRNAQLVQDQEVRLEYDLERTDYYDRTLAYVYVGSAMVNELLVAGGYGKALVIPPNERYADRMRALQAKAQRARAGLWGRCP